MTQVPLPQPPGFEFKPVRGDQIIPKDLDWIWKPFIARGVLTIFYAYWKCGKTTLMHFLLRAAQSGGKLVTPDPVVKGDVLYITEESELMWSKKALDFFPVPNNTYLVCRPCAPSDPTHWEALCHHIVAFHAQHPFHTLVIDPISDVWPTDDENDAVKCKPVYGALRAIATSLNVGIMLVHHVSKGAHDDTSADIRRARGSGVHLAMPDIIIELKRKGHHASDRRRVLDVRGRVSEQGLYEVRLLPDKSDYVLENTPQDPHQTRLDVIRAILKADPTQGTPKARRWSVADLILAWPTDPMAPPKPAERTLRRDLEDSHALAGMGVSKYNVPPAQGGIQIQIPPPTGGVLPTISPSPANLAVPDKSLPDKGLEQK